MTRTTHPSGYISSRGSRGGRIKKKKKKKRARRILGAYRVEIVRGILQLRNRGQLSDFGRGEQRNNDNNNGQIVLPEIRCDLLRGFFLPLLPYLSLSLCLSSWGRKREEEEREKKKLSLFRSVNANERYIWKAGKTCQRAVFIRWNASSPPKTVYTLMHLHPVARLNSF